MPWPSNGFNIGFGNGQRMTTGYHNAAVHNTCSPMGTLYPRSGDTLAHASPRPQLHHRLHCTTGAQHDPHPHLEGGEFKKNTFENAFSMA